MICIPFVTRFSHSNWTAVSGGGKPNSVASSINRISAAPVETDSRMIFRRLA